MGIFEFKVNTVGNTVNKQMLPPEVAECDRKLQENEEKRKDVLIQIGTTYVEESTEESIAKTPYEALVKQFKILEAEKNLLEKRKLAIQGLRKCETCGNINPLDSAFCNKCGEKFGALISEVPDGRNICPKCGAEYDTGAAFCVCCGNKLEQPE